MDETTVPRHFGIAFSKAQELILTLCPLIKLGFTPTSYKQTKSYNLMTSPKNWKFRPYLLSLRPVESWVMFCILCNISGASQHNPPKKTHELAPYNLSVFFIYSMSGWWCWVSRRDTELVLVCFDWWLPDSWRLLYTSSSFFSFNCSFFFFFFCELKFDSPALGGFFFFFFFFTQRLQIPEVPHTPLTHPTCPRHLSARRRWLERRPALL